MNDEERRSKVDKLLRECVGDKLMFGQTGLALEKAEQAYSLAIQSPEVPSPWPELAAYRLAHLMLRSPDSDSDLSEIEELLRFAGKPGPTGNQPVLAPRPVIYRLAVLKRIMHKTSNETDRRGIESQIKHAFKQARDQVEGLLREDRMTAGTRGSYPTGPIQHSFFNMLELTAYFLGETYSPLEGLGALDISNVEESDAWVILGPDSEIGSVRMSRQLAMFELEARAKSHPAAVLFCLASGSDDPAWRLASTSKWQTTNYEGIKLLAYLLRDPSIRRKELRGKVVGYGADQNDRFRKAIERVQTGLQDVTGRSDMRVFVPRSNPLSFDAPLLLFGAVQLDTLRG